MRAGMGEGAPAVQAPATAMCANPRQARAWCCVLRVVEEHGESERGAGKSARFQTEGHEPSVLCTGRQWKRRGRAGHCSTPEALA